MALNFPNSPTNGQIYTDALSGNSWTFDSANTCWKSTSTYIQTITISSSAPGTPAVGQLWWNRDYGRLLVYYSDGDTSQWVDASPSDYTSGLAYQQANTVFGVTNAAFSVANAAFGKANTALQNTTSTFAGDLTITGNTIIGASSSYVHSGYFAVASSDNNGWAASFSSNSASGAASTGLVLGVRSGRAAIGGISGYDMSLCPDGGRVLKPNQPAWSGYTTSFATTGTGNHRAGINWTYNGGLSGALRNVGNLWNTTTGRVTIPVSGYWLICATAHKNNNNVDRTIGTISVNGSDYEFAECYGSYQDVGWAQIIYLAANDWIECGRNYGLLVDAVDFSGYLLG